MIVADRPSKEKETNLITQIFRITGGNDKQGFPMKQGVVRLALRDQASTSPD
jgi:ribosomal protein S6E (S10)